MRLHERILLYGCRRSDRVYKHASFTVPLQCGSRMLRIPIMRGCGISVLNYQDECLQQVVAKFYAQGRRGFFIDIGANQG